MLTLHYINATVSVRSLWNNEFGLRRHESGKFEVSTEFPGLAVEYSVYGGHTWSRTSSSSFYANKSTTYQFITRSARCPL